MSKPQLLWMLALLTLGVAFAGCFVEYDASEAGAGASAGGATATGGAGSSKGGSGTSGAAPSGDDGGGCSMGRPRDPGAHAALAALSLGFLFAARRRARHQSRP